MRAVTRDRSSTTIRASSEVRFTTSAGIQSALPFLLTHSFECCKAAMSFSWSAPRFTELDEKLERESLSESESREVFDDLVGAYESPQEHPELLSLTDETFHRLLAGTPRCVKDAYADALERAPDLVATETPPLVFLRATDFQPDVS